MLREAGVLEFVLDASEIFATAGSTASVSGWSTRSMRRSSSVWVVSDTAATAEGLATSLFFTDS